MGLRFRSIAPGPARGGECSGLAWAAGVAMWAGLAVSAANAQWTVVNLHPTGALQSAATGVSAGQQSGWAQLGPTVGHTRASLWTGSAASWVNLHPATTTYSRAYAAGDGQQVGEAPVNLSRAALWNGSAGTWVDLHPAAAGENASIAYAVSGGVQVGSANVLGWHASLWTGSAGSWVDLNPPGHVSEAWATTGTRHGGYVVDVGSVVSASVWSGSSSSWTNLHPAGNISSWVYALDATQQVGAVRVPDTSSHAALWTGSASSWVDLHPFPQTNSRATGVAGGMQVGYADGASGRHAALWRGTAASRVDLHSFLPMSFLTSEATGIWTDGVETHVSGFGYNSATTRQEAILWIGPGAGCYANCDGSTGTPLLTVNDFVCFLNLYAIGDPRANCDGSTTPPILNINDFVCFLSKFAVGCP